MSELRTKAEGMVNKLVVELGMTVESTFNTEKKAWYWKTGSAPIEVFIEEVPVGEGTREFLRVFSPVMKVPAGKELEVYKKLLELNDSYLGLKLTLMKDSNQVYATFERDIVGMDYNELKTCILDLEWWADDLDDKLIAEFGATK